MLEGVRGRRFGTVILVAIILAILFTLARGVAEKQAREAAANGLPALALSLDPVSLAD